MRRSATSESLLGREPAEGWSSVVASVLLGLVFVIVAAGCGASGKKPPLWRYHPPLRVSAHVLAVAPGSSRVAKHSLRVIADTLSAPRFSSTDSVSFATIQYQLISVNPGSPDAYSADQIIANEVTVKPDSSARTREEVLRPPRLLSTVDRLHWLAAGRRPFASPSDRAGASFSRNLPAGAWSFTPQGQVATFKQIRKLPTAERALTGALGRLLGATNHTTAPAALSLLQYGFLLAAAPLTRGGRKAILEAMGSLPGIHMCDALFPQQSLHGDAFCLNGDPSSTEILLDPRTGVALVVSERLDKRAPLYPNMRVGTLTSSYTFTLQPSPS